MPPLVLSARNVTALLGEWRHGASSVAYETLADAVRVLVLDGRVQVGSRLPSERQLADSLALSRTTVAAAYARLRSDGYLVSKRGSGSVVRMPAVTGAHADVARLTGATTALLDLRKAAMPAAPGVAEAAERALRALPAALADVGYDTVGDPGLRAAIADRYTARGLPTTPEQIMVTLGAQHAIGMLARMLIGRGDTVLVESPTYPHAHEALRQAGGRLVGVPVDPRTGWDVQALTASIRRSAPAMAYVMPELQNPTGATMPDDTRLALLAAAADAGTVVVADETMGELRIEGRVHEPLATLGRAVMIGSADKTMWGALRIGWIRADTDLIGRLVLARPTFDLGTPILEQLVVRELVPVLDTVLVERRRHLRDGRDHVVAELARRMPEWDVPVPEGGLSTWIGLGRPVSSALVLAAREEGLALASGGAFGPDGGYERFLRLPFSSPRGDREVALDALERAWRRIGGVETSAVRTLAQVV